MTEDGLKLALCNIEGFKCEDGDFRELANSFRSVRNYCASGRHAQMVVAQCQNTLSASRTIAYHLLSTGQDNLCLLICLQFIANYLVDNKQHQCEVWETFSEEILLSLRYAQEPKIQNCAAMIIYNVLLDNHELMQDIEASSSELIELTQNEITAEYSVFILELLLCSTRLIEKLQEFSCSHRLILLNICSTMLKSRDMRKFPVGMIRCLGNYFIEKSHCVLISPQDSESVDAVEVARVLEVINSLTAADPSCLEEIQSNAELLVHGITLLRTVHTISKEKGNNFSMLLKLSDLEESESNETLQNDPTFGFKASLVALVGNMCWHHREHQDTAREMDAIPLILDTCNIDARNPLIIQWAVLAMRNLCEDNLENQRIVASVDSAGQVDSSRLSHLGLNFNGK